jgi:O-antigen/teichoic acid export membrane protein
LKRPGLPPAGGLPERRRLDSLATSGGPVVQTLRARLRRGVIWSVAAALATSGFNFVLKIIIARLFGRESFGEFGMVLSTVVTVAGIAQVAMGYTATKFVAEFRTSDPARAGRVIALSSIVSACTGSLAAFALCAGARWLAANSLGAPQLSGSLQLSSIMVFFAVLVGYQMGALAGLENYRSLAILALATGVANVIPATLGAATWGLNGAVGGMGAGGFLQWLMFRWATEAECRRLGIPVCRRGVLSERAVLFSFALPAALCGLSGAPAIWLANAFLARQPDGFSQLALYTAAFSVRSLVSFLPRLINSVTMSLLNNQKGLQDWDGYRRVFRTNVVVTGASVVLAALGVGLVGVPILALFGRDFRAGYPVLLVLLLAAILEGAMASMYQIVQAESRMWSSLFFISLPRDLLIVCLAYVLSPDLGALGVAVAYAAGWLVACLTTGLLVARVSPWMRSSRVVLGGEGL